MSGFLDRAHGYPGAKTLTLSTKWKKSSGIFANVRPEEVGNASQTACEKRIIRARPKFRAGIYKGTKPWLSVLFSRPR